MATIAYLLLMALPIAIAFGGGYFLGKDVMSHQNEVERWDAFDAALSANTDSAWDVYYAAYPRETK